MSRRAPKSQAIAGELYNVLATKLPVCCNENGVLEIAGMAEMLSMSAEGVYRWLRSNQISRRGRKALVELANSTTNVDLLNGKPALTEDDLLPFS